jgi:predicted RNase H-like HicB family nuclease
MPDTIRCKPAGLFPASRHPTGNPHFGDTSREKPTPVGRVRNEGSATCPAVGCYHGGSRLFSMRYTVILEGEADGGYVATVPALPGCVSQGDTRDEVMRNIREAADLYVEDCIALGDPVPTEAGKEYLELVTSSHR